MIAKFPEALPREREKYNAAMQAMLQKMLVDRFKLAAHRDKKAFAVYALIVGKNGIKISEVPGNGSHSSSSSGRHYEGKCVNMAAFADFLARRIDLPVLDMTQLRGYYDMKLDWPEDPDSADNPSKPALRDAIEEQLGLKLESRKAPLEILVVDHIERIPTEN